MTGFARFALAVALLAALCFGVRASAAAPVVAHLTYSGVFDVDRSHGDFRLSYVATPSTNLIGDSVFGIDVELPIFMRTSATPLYDGISTVRLAENLQRFNLSTAGGTPWVTGVTFRLHGARIQMQYRTVDAATVESSRAQMPAPDGPASAVELTNTFGELTSAQASSIAPSFSYASPSPFADLSTAGAFAPFAPAPARVVQRLSLPVRVGPVHFASNLESSAVPDAPASSFDALRQCGSANLNAACANSHEHDNRFAAGTSFDVRAGARRVNFDLSGSVEHQLLSDQTEFPYIPLDPQAPAASTQAAPLGGQSAVAYPNLVDVTKRGLNAKVAVPVNSHVTVDLGFDTQHYQGGYNAALTAPNASTLVPSIDARKDTYAGNITYQLPHTSSAITFSARQYRYQDTYVPNLNLTQTRADVNFTVKF